MEDLNIQTDSKDEIKINELVENALCIFFKEFDLSELEKDEIWNNITRGIKEIT